MWWTSLFTLRNAARILGGLLLGGSTLFFVYGPITTFTLPLLALGLAAGGALLVATYFSDLHARAEAEKFAKHTGWTFEDQRSGLFARLKTPPFHTSEASYTQVVSGQFGGFECFDGIYEWRVRLDNDAKITGRHRIAAVRMPDELPRIMLIPEGLTSRLVKLFGGADRDFESSSFNRNWRVLADDPRVAHEMLSPRVLERLDAMPVKAPLLFEKGLAVRIDSDGARIGTLADRLSGIIAVARFIPAHTIDDHGRLANSIGPLPSVALPGALTGGYKAELAAQDEEYLRTAKPRKAQRWIDAARDGNAMDLEPPTH